EENAQEVEEEAAEEEKEETSEKHEEKKKGHKHSSRALELELEKKTAQLEEQTDKYKRLMAEFENARKRTEKESKRMYDIGAKEVLEKLLPVVDNFERGLAALDEETKATPFAEGIEKIYKQILVYLEDVGVKPMDSVGKEFNPDLHNAVMHIEDEEFEENVVVEEFQKGYYYKEEVLRHGMVKVAN
ncbi:MAG: nucleotide exchange factor GrpE, partial [Lachnospiraceae bacterium]|nr:nucleotide exchange factor GrpE [Lachnospiraceae bacterium]